MTKPQIAKKLRALRADLRVENMEAVATGLTTIIDALARATPAKTLPEPKRAERKAAKKESARERRRRIYAEVDARESVCAVGRGFLVVGGCSLTLEHDHWLGGSGQKSEKESAANAWRLCGWHHRMRQENVPSAAFWNEIRREYCDSYCLPFEPHIEHAAVAR